MERSRNHRRRGVPGSCTYDGKYPAQNERFGIHGIFEREERDDYISKMGKYEIRIPKPRILVQGILCGYCHITLWTLLQYIIWKKILNDSLSKDSSPSSAGIITELFISKRLSGTFH